MEQYILLGANFVTGWINNLLHRFLLWIDSGIYKLVSMSYQLFVYLSSVEIFTQDFFKSFALRIYAILGVFMLFYLAYALLNAIIDPDKGIAGEKGVGKIAFNLVKALVLLGLLPTIFSYAMRLQNFILSENIIGTIILGTSKEDTNNILITFGDNMSYKVMNAFINPEEYNFTLDSGVTWSYAVKNYLLGSGGAAYPGGDYSWLPDLAPAVTSPQQVPGVGSVTATYLGVISSIAGGFLIYIILSFCLDLGVRVVKLAYCQLIAPIPIVLSIIPSKKSVMDKWVKLTISTYFEVFVRVGIMYLVAYFMSKFFTNNTILNSWGNGMVGKFGMVVIILGLFAFAKQLPKLISDTLGIDSGSIKLGIRDKLKTSVEGMDATIGRIPGTKKLAGATTGALGAGWTSMVNGNGLWEGLKYGAIKGGKDGGFQFGKQRQGLYEAFGGKGKAGWFGSRGLVDRVAADTVDHVKDDYFDKTLPVKIANFESGEFFKDYFGKAMAATKTRLENEKGSNEEKLVDLNKARKDEENDWKAKQKARIEALKDEYNKETDEVKKSAIQQSMALIMQEEFTSVHDEDIQKLEKRNKEIEQTLDPKAPKNVVDPVTNQKYSQLEIIALAEARKNARDKNQAYSADLKARNKRLSDKNTKAYLDTPEGQIAVAVHAAGEAKAKQGAPKENPKPDGGNSKK